MLKLAKIQIPLQKWQHLLILLQPQRVTLPFQRKFCYPPTPGSHQICLSLWYTFWKKGLLRTCKVLATQTIFVYNRGTSCHYISAGMGTFQVKNRQFFYNLHLTLSARGEGGGKGDRNGQKFSGQLVTFETIAIEILPLSRSFWVVTWLVCDTFFTGPKMAKNSKKWPKITPKWPKMTWMYGKWLLKPSPLKFCPSRGRFEWSHD